jgi:hypothetical protein
LGALLLVPFQIEGWSLLGLKGPVPGHACSACKATMRLVTIEPHPRYLNIDVQNYSCDCGHSEDFLVAHKD